MNDAQTRYKMARNLVLSGDETKDACRKANIHTATYYRILKRESEQARKIEEAIAWKLWGYIAIFLLLVLIAGVVFLKFRI